jgi:AcrR family transcriptional regulator
LRERKRTETRRALTDAALRLFREKGFVGTSVDEIAAGANVSRSTFFRYFGSKEAVLFAEGEEVGRAFVALLKERPLEEDSVTAFEEALVQVAVSLGAEASRTQSRLLDELFQTDPALNVRRIMESERWTRTMAEAFAARRNRDPISEDRLASAVCISTTEEVGRCWREEGHEVVDAIRSTFAALRSTIAP